MQGEAPPSSRITPSPYLIRKAGEHVYAKNSHQRTAHILLYSRTDCTDHFGGLSHSQQRKPESDQQVRRFFVGKLSASVKDKWFWNAMLNTGKWALFTVSMEMIVGMTMAFLMNMRLKGQS